MVKVKIIVSGLVRVGVSASVRVRVRVRVRVEALVGRRVKEAERLWFLGISGGHNSQDSNAGEVERGREEGRGTGNNARLDEP